MTDQTIPAGLTRDQAQAVREWAERARGAEIQDETVAHAARVLLAVLPTRPTLADMTEEERKACQWMQADLDPVGRAVIVNPHWEDGSARVMWPGGFIEQTDWGKVTPRPDLPRLEWPGDQKADDVPPVKVGDVIESADDPRLAALPVWTVLRDLDGEEVTRSEGAPGTWRGTGYIPIAGDGTEFGPWTVRRIGLESADATD